MRARKDKKKKNEKEKGNIFIVYFEALNLIKSSCFSIYGLIRNVLIFPLQIYRRKSEDCNNYPLSSDGYFRNQELWQSRIEDRDRSCLQNSNQLADGRLYENILSKYLQQILYHENSNDS